MIILYGGAIISFDNYIRDDHEVKEILIGDVTLSVDEAIAAFKMYDNQGKLRIENIPGEYEE